MNQCIDYAECFNTAGSYLCGCDVGYLRTDDNECIGEVELKQL